MTRCPVTVDGFPYEHLHRCTKQLDHKLHDEPDNDVHLCSCGARWRPWRGDLGTRSRRQGGVTMPWDNPSTDEVDQVHAESRDDLQRLMAAVPKVVAKYGPIRGAVELTTQILLEPSWTRMELASVLGVALVQLDAARADSDG